MRLPSPAFALCTAALLFGTQALLAATVGSNSPTPAIQVAFITAFYRGQFSALVNAPTADVTALGSPGLQQLFAAKVANGATWSQNTAYLQGQTIVDPANHVQQATFAGTSGARSPTWNDKGGNTVDGTVTWADQGVNPSVYALVLANPNAADDPPLVWQVWGAIYNYYTAVGVGAAGYPTMDTATCPTNSFGTCVYQIFTSNYALFSYSNANMSVKDPYFTAWSAGGGIGTLGAPIAVPAAVTSVSGVAGNQQYFANGVAVSYPASSSTAPAYAVSGDFFGAYNLTGGAATLGFPTSSPITVNAAGLVRQTFENGRIEQTPGGTPIVLYSLTQLSITGAATGLSLQPGDTTTLRAIAIDAHGLLATGRALSWSTSNGAVATVQGAGDTATLKAVAGGVASIYVTGEGKTSLPINIRVSSVCCAVGEGTPSSATAQAFQAAVYRNALSVKLPVASPATRTGAGYVQTLVAADGSGTIYLIAQADNSGTAWLLTGGLYAAYLTNGGFTGTLGYPASDPLPGNVQKFVSGAALAGIPAVVVHSAVAAKWFLLGGISGQPGAPVGSASTFLSTGGRSGVSQSFTGGTIYAVTSGTLGSYLSSGLILARYLALTGPAGALGAPTGDIVLSATGVLSQTFEGGSIDLQPGAATAVEHLNPRHPALTASPALVVPGGRVHIAATGFAPGAALDFTITGQPSFSTLAQSGVFQWDILVPPAAKSGTVSLQVVAKSGADKASASYVIAPVAAALPTLTLVSGDRQSAYPGSALPAQFIAVLKDSAGAPLSGVPASVTVSPGASYQAPATTDASGIVRVAVRMPLAAGVVVGSISAGGKTVDFSALAVPGSIPNFPQFTQNSPALLGPGPATLAQQGGLVATLAALIRFQQNTGTLASPNGLATPVALNAWLTTPIGFQISENGNPIADPWVAAQFAKGSIVLEDPGFDNLRDRINAGTPVGLLINLGAAGRPLGSAAVAAAGIAADGSILISDPNPASARPSLADYLGSQGSIAAAFRVVPTQAPGPFVVASPIAAGAALSSPVGMCPAMDLQDPWTSAASPALPTGIRYAFCDGSQAAYEVDFTAQKGAQVVDLSAATSTGIPPNSGTALQLTRSGTIQTAPLAPSITSVTDSAGYGTVISPGGLISIFGTGLAGAATSPPPNVTLSGIPLKVLAAYPFQVNAILPESAAPGTAVLVVSGPAGSASRSVVVSSTSPGIFVIGTGGERVVGAILNADGSLNGPTNPAQRGQYVSAYCAGLGATTLSGAFRIVATQVTVVIDGTVAPVSFAGLLPGFIGLYQVNFTIPASLAPTSTATLILRQGARDGNAVPLAYQ